jgi:hypothetical protein
MSAGAKTSIQPYLELEAKLAEKIAKALPNLTEYVKNDSLLLQIKNVFSLHLGRVIDSNSYDDIIDSLLKIVDSDTADILKNIISNNNLNLLKIVEKTSNDKKMVDFLKELVILYGALMRRARALKMYPNEWWNAHSEIYGDKRRGFLMRTELSLASGEKFILLSTPNSAIVLAQHLIKNILIAVNSTVEDQTGKQKSLLQFILPNSLVILKKQIEELDKCFAEINVQDAQILNEDTTTSTV